MSAFAAALLPPRPDEPDEPLPGRRALQARVDGLLAGGRGVVLVGAPGIGASSLADAACRRTGSGRRLVRIEGTPAGRAVALGAFASLIGGAHDRAPEVALVGRLLHDLLDGDVPVLLCVHDLHDLDPTSWLVVHELLSAGTRLVATTTPLGARQPDVARAWSRSGVERVDVPPLGRGAVAVLARRLVGATIDPGSVEVLHEACGGNPLHLRVLVGEAVQHGRFVAGHDGLWLRSIGDGSALGDLLAAHLDGLDDAARRVLDVLAVGGRTDESTASRLGMPGDDVPAVLDRLVADGIVSRRSAHRAVTVGIEQASWAAAVRSRLTDERRRTIHAALGHARPGGAPLGGRPADEPSTAEPGSADARRATARAAAAALVDGRLRDAIDLARSVVGGADDASGRGRAVLAPALALTGHAREALALACDADGGDTVDEHHAVLARTELGELHAASLLAARAVERRGRGGDPGPAAWAELAAARVAVARGHGRAAMWAGTSAAERFDILDRAALARYARTLAAGGSAIAGDRVGVLGAAALLQEGTEPTPLFAIDAGTCLALVAHARGERDRVRSAIRASLEACRRSGAPVRELAVTLLAARISPSEVDPDRVRALRDETEGPWPRLLIRAIDARTNGGAEALEHVGSAFRSRGADLLAAECFAAAAAHHDLAGDRGRRLLTVRVVDELVDACGGVALDTVACRHDIGISARELEVCRLVVELGPSRAVADALGVSVRTVNNHLQRAYQKLGIGSRAELGAIFRLEPAAVTA